MTWLLQRNLPRKAEHLKLIESWRQIQPSDGDQTSICQPQLAISFSIERFPKQICDNTCLHSALVPTGRVRAFVSSRVPFEKRVAGGPGLAMLDLTQRMGAPGLAFETWESIAGHQPPCEVSLSLGRAG